MLWLSWPQSHQQTRYVSTSSCHYGTYRADPRFAPSQWETALLCNDVSHWLGASLESTLYLPVTSIQRRRHRQGARRLRLCSQRRVSADVLASFGARTSTDAGMTKLLPSMHREQTLKSPYGPATSRCNNYVINSLSANIFTWNKNLFAIYIIAPHWHDTGSWNPSSCKTKTCLFYIINIVAADGLVTQTARASVTMILNILYRSDWVPAHWGLICGVSGGIALDGVQVGGAISQMTQNA